MALARLSTPFSDALIDVPSKFPGVALEINLKAFTTFSPVLDAISPRSSMSWMRPPMIGIWRAILYVVPNASPIALPQL